MRVPYKWLLEFIPIVDKPEEIAELLTSRGIETEYIFDIGERVEGVVVGEIIKVMNHPNADNLKLCLVSDGRNINTVVCGAPNVKKGIKVAYAKPGAKIHGGIEIGKKNIRGQVSTGMLLSERELGWGSSHDGIYVFPQNTSLGVDVNDLKKGGDEILEIEITANRPDLLSIYGVAREIALLKGMNISEWKVEDYQKFDGERKINVILEEGSCIFYSGRIIECVNVSQSPSWMVEKLRLYGINSVNNVVDITNYILCAYGQPLHAFDLDRIEGDIFVRSAKEGEEVVLLDGKKYRMKGGEIVIADSKKILALAGVMGAENSKVTEDTKNIFLESAYFYPEKVRYASKVHSIMTDSSYRFERGVDPEGVLKGLEEASCMISRICSGKVNSERIERGSLERKEKIIEVTEEIVENIIGVKIEREVIRNILSKIGRIEEKNEKILFSPPGYRKDLNIKESVAGEIGRIYGFDKIPSKIPPLTWIPKGKDEREVLYEKIKSKLTGFGFFEVINSPLISSEQVERFYREKILKIENPLTKPQDALSPTLIFGMLKNVKFNISRGEKNIFLFEIGKVFLPEERRAIGIIGTGDIRVSWRKRENFDFFYLKGIVNAILDGFGVKFEEDEGDYSIFSKSQIKFLVDGKVVGFLGEISQDLKKIYDITHDIFYSEIYPDEIPIKRKEVKIKKYFPPVLRDISVIAKRNLTYNRIYNIIRNAGGDILKEVQLIDVYKGPQIKEDEISYTFHLKFQKEDETLRDDMCDNKVKEILEELSKNGIKLR